MIFQDWLNSSTRDGSIVRNILVRMIQEMTDVLKEDGYVIKDQKAFRGLYGFLYISRVLKYA